MSLPARGAERPCRDLATTHGGGGEVVWHDNDAFPIREPAEDDEGTYQWWYDAQSLSTYQAGKVLDLGDAAHAVVRAVRLVGPREAVNVNQLDEVPDSTWFTNRHGRNRLSAAALAQGPNQGPPPASDGPLIVESGKGLGEAPGFNLRDIDDRRYLMKFDPKDHPELATGAEQVAARIVYALGWHVPEYHLVALDPKRLQLAADATTRDTYNRKRPMTEADLQAILARVARRPDGLIRATASRILPGTPKGPFRFEGTRADDPNDTVPHEDRRDLRGLRVVAALINHTDFRPANTLDMFVPATDEPHALGHVVHYLLDFSSTLGSADLEWKAPKLGHEYIVDPPIVVANYASVGLWVKSWEDAAVVHPSLGYFSADTFDPSDWKAEVPAPMFDRATLRDELWGARLVASLTDADLRAIVATGEWADAAAEAQLHRVLMARRQRIAQTFFAASRVNPAAGFMVRDGALHFEDPAVSSGVVAPEVVLYRYRYGTERWTETREAHVPLPAGTQQVALQTSHDRGAHWSPTTHLALDASATGAPRLVCLERETRG